MQILAELNPYTHKDGRIAYVYATGYLAGYLASLMREDPFIYKRFLNHAKQKTKKNA
jgi:hypothetical protein